MPTTVSAYARLHFGLFNLSGINGRIDGGAGIAIAAPACLVSVREGGPGLSTAQVLSDPMAHAITRMISCYRSKFGLPDCQVKVKKGIPEHVGLGSKTATLMALGRALSAHFGLGLDYIDIAGLAGRGGTSGVGVHTSEYGGVVVDRGHEYPAEKQTFVPSSASAAWPPPIGQRQAAPVGCAIIHLRLDPQGLSGEAEKLFFQQNCPIPDEETQRLLDMVEQILMPGISKASLSQINDGLGRLQQLGMKAREWRIQGDRTRTLRDQWEALRRQHPKDSLPPLCLSSIGPTVFILSEHPERIIAELERLKVPAQAVSVTAPAITGHVITNM